MSRPFIHDGFAVQLLSASLGRVRIMARNLSGVNIYLHERPEQVKENGIPLQPNEFVSFEWFGDLWAQSDAGQAELAWQVSEACR